MNKRLSELRAKEIITLDELEEIETMPQVINVEDNGMSGFKVGYHLYSVLTEDDEFEIYTN